MYDPSATRRENLLAILKERHLTQSELARLANKTPQQISAAVRGRKGFGAGMARAIEAALELLPGQLDTPIGGGITAARAFLPKEETPPEGFVAVPEYRLEFSAGNGGEPCEPEWVIEADVQPAWYRADYFQKLHVEPEKCRRAKVYGDSMEPFLCDGDTILFEEFTEKTPGANPIRDGRCYVLTIEGEYRVKRLARCLGGLIVHSDNEARYPEERFLGEDVMKLRIYGRVLEVNRTMP